MTAAKDDGGPAGSVGLVISPSDFMENGSKEDVRRFLDKNHREWRFEGCEA